MFWLSMAKRSLPPAWGWAWGGEVVVSGVVLAYRPNVERIPLGFCSYPASTNFLSSDSSCFLGVYSLRKSKSALFSAVMAGLYSWDWYPFSDSGGSALAAGLSFPVGKKLLRAEVPVPAGYASFSAGWIGLGDGFPGPDRFENRLKDEETWFGAVDGTSCFVTSGAF